MEWKHPNTITGATAEGEKYFNRGNVEESLWEEISKGNHVLFIAPRRVGKSSIAKYMAANPKNEFICIYQNIQSDASVEEFYKRLIELIGNRLNKINKYHIAITRWVSRKSIKSISERGVEFDTESEDLKHVLFDMIKDVSENGDKVVMFLDEFPDVVGKVFRNYGRQEAEKLLDVIREMRQSEEFKKVFVLVLLGSVGLNHIVNRVTGRTDKINDLHREYLDVLHEDDAIALIDHLTVGATMKLSPEVKVYITKRMGHNIPYFIQLMIEECDRILFKERRPVLTEKDVDQAYESLILNNSYFNDWNSRLKEYFPEHYKFLNRILAKCAEQRLIAIQEINDIANEEGKLDDYMELVEDILVIDGYLYEREGVYRFNSPLLNDWWKRRNRRT